MTGRVRELATRVGISGLVIALLAIFLIVQTVRIEGFKIWPLSIDGLKKERDDAIAATASCETRHAVTRASVETLEGVVDRLNEKAIERAEKYAAGRARWEADKERLERDAARSGKRIADLRDMIDRPVDGNCPIPDDMREALEGL